ncbi:hypothetical protein I4U23_004893 [Adineta vaga]|nr:hypothetical protein I4U23_004893 [Adineta vaga]
MPSSQNYLYDTENSATSEQFDCIYVIDEIDIQYGDSTAGRVPYCRRPDKIESFEMPNNKCGNEAETKYFVNLLKDNISPIDVLQWSSSIEMADEYSEVYYGNRSLIHSDEERRFLCHCTQQSTFGKFCEYELTHDMNSFKLSHTLQAYTRMDNSAAILCVDWRDICDSVQQCESGWDEENYDKLEFNEFRCDNGNRIQSIVMNVFVLKTNGHANMDNVLHGMRD